MLAIYLPCTDGSQEIPAANPGSIALLKSEACSPSAVASKLPAKSPCYTFYSYRTPAPAPAPAPPTPSAKVPSSEPRNTFQASEGGARSVTTSWAPKTDSQTEPEAPAELEKEDSATPSVTDLSLQETETSSSAQQSSTASSRVIFIYTCPSASPVKFRMVYSSGVRSIQQDAKDKVGMEIAAKVSTLTKRSAKIIARNVRYFGLDRIVSQVLPSQQAYPLVFLTYAGGCIWPSATHSQPQDRPIGNTDPSARLTWSDFTVVRYARRPAGCGHRHARLQCFWTEGECEFWRWVCEA